MCIVFPDYSVIFNLNKNIQFFFIKIVITHTLFFKSYNTNMNLCFKWFIGDEYST